MGVGHGVKRKKKGGKPFFLQPFPYIPWLV